MFSGCTYCFAPSHPPIQIHVDIFFSEGSEYYIVINCGSWDIWQVLNDKFATFKYDQYAAMTEKRSHCISI